MESPNGKQEKKGRLSQLEDGIKEQVCILIILIIVILIITAIFVFVIVLIINIFSIFIPSSRLPDGERQR